MGSCGSAEDSASQALAFFWMIRSKLAKTIAEPPLQGHPGGVPSGPTSQARRGIAVAAASVSSWGSALGLARYWTTGCQPATTLALSTLALSSRLKLTTPRLVL